VLLNKEAYISIMNFICVCGFFPSSNDCIKMWFEESWIRFFLLNVFYLLFYLRNNLVKFSSHLSIHL